ncbi:hypothetical protein K1719_003509 [Acacia pycnantha]|nr:hypothetical protein K1719_003509 [Acacia pycnantha]
MIAKRNSRKRNLIVEPEKKVGKMPVNNKSNGKGKKSASGSRFDVLQDVEDRIHSKGVDRLRKTEVDKTTWRRKEDSSTVREKKEKVMKVKEKEGKDTNALVGHPEILSKPSDGFNLRPNGLSSVRNMKKAARAHNVIFGSTKSIGISKVSEAKEQAGGEKENYEEKVIVDIVPCNLDIGNSSSITIKNGKNDDVDRGAEVSEVVPSSLPPDELIEHIADDADLMEEQESLVAETQFELGKDLDSGHAR